MAETFSAGEVCFAKVKGYPPWPAIVREVMPGMVYIPNTTQQRIRYFGKRYQKSDV